MDMILAVGAPTPAEDAASLYSRVAADYAAKGPPLFAHAGQRLVELAAVQPGDVVLDVGTGRGAVLLPAARKTGPSGSALGIDIAPGMVEHTSRAIQDERLQNASVQLMDVAALEVKERAFTHVLSSFSVFFFPNLPAVLKHLQGVLKPGGTAGFAFSRGTDPRWTWYEDRLRQLGAFDGLVVPQPGYPHVRDPGVLTALLDRAGFMQARETEEETDLWYASPEAWWQSLWTHGSRRALDRLAPDLLQRFQDEAIARVRSNLLQPEGVPERMRFVYVLAQASTG